MKYLAVVERVVIVLTLAAMTLHLVAFVAGTPVR